LLEVIYYTEDLFDAVLNTGRYHTIRKLEDGDPNSEIYFNMQYELGKSLEDFLQLHYGDQVIVQERYVAADYWGVEVDASIFSDRMINDTLCFLADKSPSYSIIFCLYEGIDEPRCPYLGRVILTIKKIGVTQQTKALFEARCSNSLCRSGSLLSYRTKSNSVRSPKC